MNEYYINPIFPFVLPMKSHNICYAKQYVQVYLPVLYYILIFLIFITLL